LSASNGLKFSGEVRAGLPTLQLPPISATVGNQTYGFVDMLSTIGSGSIVVPLLAILENIAIAKAFCKNFSEYKIQYN